jgi:hypothetical protein
LLARQQEDGTWSVGESSIVPIERPIPYADGVLVLTELTPAGEVSTPREARDWILEVIEKYLSSDAITPEFVSREEQRIERWRQEITVGSLELTRRNLEIETRRDQLQELEASLKLERERLDLLAARLQGERKEINPSENDEKN